MLQWKIIFLLIDLSIIWLIIESKQNRKKNSHNRLSKSPIWSLYTAHFVPPEIQNLKMFNLY